MEARALQPLAVVEDSDEDFEALSRVLRETTSREGVRRYASGEDALAGLLEGSEGTFPLPAGVDLSEYSVVDVSREPSDGDPAHSGDSIVRGALADDAGVGT